MAAGDVMGVFKTKDSLWTYDQTTQAEPTYLSSSGITYSRLFGDADIEIHWASILPRHYAGGGLSVHINTSMISDAGNVRVGFAIQRFGDGLENFDESAGFDTTVWLVKTAATVNNGFMIDILNNSNLDSLVAGECFRIKIIRDASHASDTHDGDMRFVGFILTEGTL